MIFGGAVRVVRIRDGGMTLSVMVVHFVMRVAM